MEQSVRFSKFFSRIRMASSEALMKRSNDALVATQLQADLRLAWKYLDDAGHDAAAERLFRFLSNSATAMSGKRSGLDMAVVVDNGDRPYVLSAEECFEVKRALTGSMKRTEAAVENLKDAPSMTGPGGVVERAKHSHRILAGVLRKFT
jgi:hypothetical protein